VFAFQPPSKSHGVRLPTTLPPSHPPNSYVVRTLGLPATLRIFPCLLILASIAAFLYPYLGVSPSLPPSLPPSHPPDLPLPPHPRLDCRLPLPISRGKSLLPSLPSSLPLTDHYIPSSTLTPPSLPPSPPPSLPPSLPRSFSSSSPSLRPSPLPTLTPSTPYPSLPPSLPQVLFFFVSILKALSYSLNEPCKEMLYIPTSDIIRYAPLPPSLPLSLLLLLPPSLLPQRAL